MSIKELAIACTAALWGVVSAAEQEKVTLTPDDEVMVELCAEKIPAEERTFAPGICVWNGQLWHGSVSSPPEKVLVSGAITIEGERIELDVSGLANPWIFPQEMTNRHCRLRKLHIGEDAREVCYVLDVAFFKGGALDYVVTWVIYENSSLRSCIEDMGDTYPEWYGDDDAQISEDESRGAKLDHE